MTTTTTADATYLDLDLLPIAGRWRRGRSDHTIGDLDPWSGERILDIQAARTTPTWMRRTRLPPSPRANGPVPVRPNAPTSCAVPPRSSWPDTTSSPSWLRRESGGTVVKIEVELGVLRAGFLEAAAMPHHAGGQILPSDIPGKENRVYRASGRASCA